MRFSRRSSTVFALAIAALGVMLNASVAEAAVYVTGSYSLQSTHLGYQVTESDYGSASIDVDLGRYIRLGYTYGLEKTSTQTYKDPTAFDPNNSSLPGYCTTACGLTSSKTTVIQNSIGLTIILYEGQVFMPFLLVGGTRKDVTTDSLDYDKNGNLDHTVQTTPGQIVPYGGGGVGIRLNKDFTLKFSYQVSPGVVQQPFQPAQRVLDRQSTVGLSYQL